jgi:DNA helicase-2/ATP-dependent DNA helicase PcrA
MKIEKFYREGRCSEYAALSNLLFEQNRHYFLKKAIGLFATLVASKAPVESIMRQVSDYLASSYSEIDFPFSWQASQYAEDDTKRFWRFLRRICNEKVVKANCATSFQTLGVLPDGSDSLEGFVHLILQDENGGYHAFIIHGGSCNRSMKGRSSETAASCDLHAMVAKYSLESEYPGIVIHSVYLSHRNDLPGAVLPDMEISTTSSSNMHTLDFQCYADANGEWDMDFMAENIMRVVRDVTRKKVSCYECPYAGICKTPQLQLEVENLWEQEEEHVYSMPEFTEDQNQVVCHKDGPMLVCAGPGSGKTATLIGRIRHLVEVFKVVPQFLLIVTFTNEAAKELKNRCLSFLDENNLPCISTLHAFAYRVLRENKKFFENPMPLLTKDIQLGIIENIMSVMPEIPGFKYGKERGDSGLYATVLRKLNQFFTMTEFEFFQKNPEIGHSFVTLANQYQKIINANHYITFDEQITLTRKLFAEHPEVLSNYQKLYKYIMVDEYQDVNEDQVGMIYSLAEHGNLVVVGDDDQNIYGFRGASSEYMLNFTQHYPGAKTVILHENFRSTKSLVDAAQTLIGKNQKRIPKDIRSGNNEVGKDPIVVQDMTAAAIDQLINELLEQGYRYDDIAILSTRNAPLEELHEELQAPSVLAKSYLRYDGLFLFAYSVLRLYRSEMRDDEAFLYYLSLFGKRDSLYHRRDTSGRTLYETYLGICMVTGPCPLEISILKDMCTFLSAKPTITAFLTMCVYKIKWHQSNAMEILMEQVEKQKLANLEAFYHFAIGVVRYTDELRVEVQSESKVTLITCHDSKGKEYPVVIMRNDYKMDGNPEEVRRLVYVAMTRAKKQLFILHDASSKMDFLKDIPHKVRG